MVISISTQEVFFSLDQRPAVSGHCLKTCKDQQGQLVLVAVMERMEAMARTAVMERLLRMHRQQQVVQDQPDHKVRKVQPVLQDLLDQRDLLAQRDHKVPLVHLDQVVELKDHKVQRVQQALQVQRELLEQQVQQEAREQQVRQVLRVMRGQRVQQVLQVRRGLRE